jgi:hypothetical protein
MNTTTIVLGTVLIIIIVFMLFQDYFTGKTKLEKQQHLLDSSPPSIISNKLASPGAVNFTYTIWVFVNSINTDDMTIFNRNKDTKLYLEGSTGKLIAMMGTSEESIDITNNFPLQKWVCVTISLNNNIMDAYLDGKMVKSVKLNTPYSNSPGNSINFGHGVDIYISNFERVPSPTDPKTAYDKYLAGSGGASLVSTLLGNMNVNLSVLQNNVETSRFALI